MPMNARLLRPQAGGGFDPRTISGLNLWLDFSDSASVVLDENSLIQEIKDKSGNGRHGTQTTAANRPAVGTLNGRNVANWGTASNSKGLTWSAGGNTSNWREVVIAAVWDAGGTTFPSFNGVFCGSTIAGTTNGAGLLGSVNNPIWFGGVSAWPTARILNGVTTDTAFTTIRSPFVVQFFRTSDVAVNGYAIGTDRDVASRGWQGRIAEVISYNRELSATERATVRTGMAKKWGVTL